MSLSLSSLPPDVLRLLAAAKNMRVDDIIALCRTDRQINSAICNNKQFWVDLARKRWQSDWSKYELSDIKSKLRILEQALDKLTNDKELIRNIAYPILTLYLDLLGAKRDETLIDLLDSRSILMLENLIRMRFDKAVLSLLQDPRMTQDIFNRIIRTSEALITDNRELLYRLLQDPRYDALTAITLLNAAQARGDEDLIDYLMDHPPVGRMWVPPQFPDDDWQLVYSEY